MKLEKKVIDEITHDLAKLTEPERKLKELYCKYGRLATLEEADRADIRDMPTHPLSIWNNPGLYEHRYHGKDFEEQYFFPNQVDVFFMKHNCYSILYNHSHNFYEICYVQKGCCTQTIFRGENSEQILMKEGDFLFIAPGHMHNICVDTDSVVLNIGIRKTTFYQTFYNQIPDDTILGQFFYNDMKSQEKNGFLRFETGSDQPLWESYCEFIYTYMHPDRYTKKLLILQLSMMFIDMLKSLSASVASIDRKQAGRNLVPAVIAYFEAQAGNTSVVETAAEFGYSPDYLNRLFKQATNKTLSQTLTDIRMSEAEKLLRYGNISVADIAEYVGYADETNFIRNFKKAYGMSPKKYRSEKSPKADF